jgi:hypothetical protein
MQLILPVLSLLLAPVAITACEGDCIIDITNEYLNRYENILLTTLQNLESASQCIISLVKLIMMTRTGDSDQRATRPRCKP